MTLTGDGVLDGQGGSDWLDYSGVTVPVTVDLPAGSATAVNASAIGRLVNFENLIGGSANDLLIGSSADNRFIGNGGDDRFVLTDNYGTDTFAGGDGADTAEFTTTTSDITFDINTTGFVATSGVNTLTSTTNDVEHLIGGLGDDTFSFIGAGTLTGGTGTLDGSAGTNTLTYAYRTGSGVAVDIAAGTATGVASIANIQNAYGSPFADVLSGDGHANVFQSNGGADAIDGAAVAIRSLSATRISARRRTRPCSRHSGPRTALAARSTRRSRSTISTFWPAGARRPTR